MNNQNGNLLGASPRFLRTLNTARMVAGTDTPVLITGEQGSGKEMLAREIHAVSQWNRGTFHVIKCTGISGPEFQLELDRVGAKREQPGSGTLFLDEVGEVLPDAQQLLLHLLESQGLAARQTGGPRIIVSSSLDLRQLVEAGDLREDLYYRLYVVPLEVPPLRDRQEDIVLLLKRFSSEFARIHNRRSPRYSVAARNLLKRYPWPGNVRELRNFCERMVILMAGQIIQPENLPQEIRRGPAQKRDNPRFLLPAEGINLMELERDVIRQALGLSGGNRSKAARLLGISRDTLLYRIQKHAIEV